jgi:hypothetical protein
MKTFTRILILGAASLALVACSQTTKEETNEAANSAADDTAANAEKAGDAIEKAGDNASAAIDKAGENASDEMEKACDKEDASAAEAKQNTGEAIEEVGKDMQQPK